MKRLLTLLLLLLIAGSSIAEFPYTEAEMWRGIPLDRLPLASVQLITAYHPPKMAGIPGREYRKPHRVAIGLCNVDTNLIQEVQVLYILINGTVSLLTPKGDVWTYDIPNSFRGIATWTEIEPTEETFYPSRPLWDWFPAVTNAPDGAYAFWWKVGTNTSDRLLLQKIGLEIKENKKNPEPSIAR